LKEHSVSPLGHDVCSPRRQIPEFSTRRSTMIHDKRRFGVVAVDSVGQFVEDLKVHESTLYIGGILAILNELRDARHAQLVYS
jgi:hypothetical protein